MREFLYYTLSDKRAEVLIETICLHTPRVSIVRFQLALFAHCNCGGFQKKKKIKLVTNLFMFAFLLLFIVILIMLLKQLVRRKTLKARAWNLLVLKKRYFVQAKIISQFLVVLNEFKGQNWFNYQLLPHVLLN